MRTKLNGKRGADYRDHPSFQTCWTVKIRSIIWQYTKHLSLTSALTPSSCLLQSLYEERMPKRKLFQIQACILSAWGIALEPQMA